MASLLPPRLTSEDGVVGRGGTPADREPHQKEKRPIQSEEVGVLGQEQQDQPRVRHPHARAKLRAHHSARAREALCCAVAEPASQNRSKRTT
jgi:hypothetical protein